MTRGLRVLLVGPYPQRPGMVVGGVEAVVSTLAPALAAHEAVLQVGVVSFHRGEIRSRCDRVGEKLRVWHLRGQRRPTLTRSALETWRTRRVAARFRPDIVHGQGINVHGDVATALSDSAVVTVHGLVHLEARLSAEGTRTGRLRTRLIDDMVRRVVDRARVVLSISEYDARSLDGMICGQHLIIPNPIAPEFFEPPPAAPRPGQILFAGAMVRRKNVEGLLQAFASASRALPEARLVMVGPTPDPAYAREIRERVASLRLGDAVIFRGHVDNAALVRELAEAGALALFSVEETSPTIIAQALAMGRPVVASAVGGIPEMIVDEQTGYLVPTGDERALATRLEHLLRSPEAGRAMGERGREFARCRFEPAAVADQTVRAYRLATGAVVG